MKFIKVSLMILVILMLIPPTACEKNQKGIEKEQISEENMNTENWSEEELNFLCELYGHEDRIRSGDLLSHEEYSVEMMRFAHKYLEKKYPGNGFTFTKCSQQIQDRNSMEISFSASGSDESYLMMVETTDDGMSGSDNFYATFIKDDFEKELKEILAFDESFIGVAADFLYTYGEKYDYTMTFEKATGKKLPVLFDLTVFFDAKLCGKTPEDLDELIVEKFESAGLHCNAWLYLLIDVPENYTDMRDFREKVKAGSSESIAYKKYIYID